MDGQAVLVQALPFRRYCRNRFKLFKLSETQPEASALAFYFLLFVLFCLSVYLLS